MDVVSIKTARAPKPAGGGADSHANPFWDSRLAREWKTLLAMFRYYCRSQHGASGALCAQCQALLDYATLKLERCRFGADKPTCANCPVHCYQRGRREQIREVMRFAGPRMITRHPILGLRHWLDGFRRAPGT